MIKTLEACGFEVSKGSDTIIDTYKTTLRSVLTRDLVRIFCCDFDRILHWTNNYPNELEEVIKSYDIHDFLILGRTPRAFETHPETQTKTESIVNQIASKILGFSHARDVIGAMRMTPRLTESMLKIPIHNKYGFFFEWPVAAWRMAENPYYVEVEGLEWETPDRFEREIERVGYETWLHSFQTPQEWEKRVHILRDGTESMLKYL